MQIAVLNIRTTILHNHHRDRTELVHSHRVHSVHLGNVGVVLVCLQVFEECGEDSKHLLDLKRGHGLHDEALVVGKEEEAATGTSSKPSILDLFDVFRWIKRVNQHVIWDIGELSDSCEGLGGETRNTDFPFEIHSIKIIFIKRSSIWIFSINIRNAVL